MEIIIPQESLKTFAIDQNTVKKILATALVVAMVTSVSAPVMAAEVPVAESQVDIFASDGAGNSDEGIMPLAGETGTIQLGSNNRYTTIITNFKPNGGYFSVLVHDFDSKKYQMDISLNGKKWNSLARIWVFTRCIFQSFWVRFWGNQRVAENHSQIGMVPGSGKSVYCGLGDI